MTWGYGRIWGFLPFKYDDVSYKIHVLILWFFHCDSHGQQQNPNHHLFIWISFRKYGKDHFICGISLILDLENLNMEYLYYQLIFLILSGLCQYLQRNVKQYYLHYFMLHIQSISVHDKFHNGHGFKIQMMLLYVKIT